MQKVLFIDDDPYVSSSYVGRSRTALTYHQSAWRWAETDGGCRLRSVPKGQEFVLDLSSYPDVHRWAEATVLLAA